MAALDFRGLGLLVPVSRGISRSEDPKAAAVELKDRINAARVRGRDVKNSIVKAVQIRPDQIRSDQTGSDQIRSDKIRSAKISSDPEFIIDE